MDGIERLLVVEGDLELERVVELHGGPLLDQLVVVDGDVTLGRVVAAPEVAQVAAKATRLREVALGVDVLRAVRRRQS